jgi:ABC-type amino acid transport substrate-binding protein
MLKMNLFHKRAYPKRTKSNALDVNLVEGERTGPQAVPTQSEDDSAQFKDFLLPLLLLLLAMLTISWYVASGYSREVVAARRNLVDLNEQEATLEQRIEVAERIQRLNALDDAAPHPKEVVKDQSFIGGHVNVAWDYKAGEVNKSLGYEVELYRNRLDGVRPTGCPVSDNDTTPEAFWKGCPGPIYFVATDPTSMTSRIPADVSQILSPGMYSWRVAPVGINSRLRSSDALEWSAFGSFTVDRSILERIRRTNRIRVGTNFAQDSPFSRLGNEGEELGFDIELVRTLIEGCTELRNDGIGYDPASCNRYLSTRDHPKPSCTGHNLCVQFVPIGKWGDWKSRLSSKDIEVFVGGITKADAREGKGIRFTDGYLTYDSRLYKRPESVNDRTTIGAWMRVPRTIGVIADSTNEKLLDTLIGAGTFSTLSEKSKISVSSFPELEHALDNGTVDGIIIDDTFVSQDDSWVTVDIPRDSQAWKVYVQTFIFASPQANLQTHEQIAVATVWDGPQSTNSLLTAINDALRSPAVRGYLNDLCRSTWHKSRSNVCDLSFPRLRRVNR